MAQGKLKAKSKVPMKVKKMKNSKKTAVTKRANKPAASKKQKAKEINKLKKIVTKNVNKAVEKEIRAIASSEGKQQLSKVQKKVAELNKASS